MMQTKHAAALSAAAWSLIRMGQNLFSGGRLFLLGG